MRLSIFKNVLARSPQETELDDIVRIMQTSERLCSLCERRNMLMKEGKKAEADDIKKGMIPAFAPAAMMYEGKGRMNVTGLTDLCFLDIDHVTDEQILAAKGILRNDNHIVLVARSISNDGLHILVRYELQGMEQPWIATMGRNRMNHTYGSVFKRCADIIWMPFVCQLTSRVRTWSACLSSPMTQNYTIIQRLYL